MNRSEILEELEKLDELDIDRISYLVAYEAAMVMYGIIPEADMIDVIGNDLCTLTLAYRRYVPQEHPLCQKQTCFRITSNINVLIHIGWPRPPRGLLIDGWHVISQSGLMYELAHRNLDGDQAKIDSVNRWRLDNGQRSLKRWKTLNERKRELGGNVK